MSRPRIYLSSPHMSEEGYELEFIKEAFASNWIAPVGPNVNAFEQEFGDYLGGDLHCAAVGSGTAALHLSIVLLGVERGDRVICSSFTFIASANPIIYQGGEPIFVDSDARTWNMDPNALEDALKACSKAGRMPKAVMSVDILGQSADNKPISDICDKYGVPMIEDAAEALGASYHV
ncbi:MAG: aminotransferase class I/II-fold pyridoxal phosphate-dependent enzyme, partial [bacterium]|nr:aminotransferase class I/II-fold pyridoxal phosphate-dependent enzyme [bacterium]